MARLTKAERNEIQTEITHQMSSMPANFLDCRDPGLRHKWERKTGFHVIPVAQVGRKTANLARQEFCERCTAVKTEKFIINADDMLEKVTQGIEYPEGYLMVGVPRGVKRSTSVWTAQYRRDMEKIAEDANSSNVRPIKRQQKALVNA